MLKFGRLKSKGKIYLLLLRFQTSMAKKAKNPMFSAAILHRDFKLKRHLNI